MSLTDMFVEIGNMVNWQNLIPIGCIDKLESRLQIEPYNENQALLLLEHLFKAGYDKNQHLYMEKVWKRLCEREHLIGYDCYHQMLRYYAEYRGPAETQAMFDQCIKFNNHASRLVE